MNRFLPGNGGGGRPRGSRNRLQSSFLNALARDFEEHGEAALKCCRLEDPSRYIAIIAA
jgi:hypothetical protein